MNLNWIDWTIVIVCVIALRMVSLSTRRYMKGVADFLSANRLAGRYLLTIASSMGNMGVISFIAGFEVSYYCGFAPGWWAGFSSLAGVVMLMTGWVFYRFRETRALTMAQFFEMRYSRRFRIFAGALCWLSGVINFGIFPAVAARFFIYFCGLPEHFHVPYLPFEMSTFATVMAVDLLVALSFVNMGGQVSIMITECVQGMVSAVFMLIIAGFLWFTINWSDVVHVMSMAPKDQSMLNPFHTSGVKDFNVWYYLIAMFGGFYTYMSWQGGQGFFSSARTPHEQRMGSIIGIWRGLPQGVLQTMFPLAALVLMKLPSADTLVTAVNATLNTIPNESIRGQMLVPVVMAHYLPIGIKGLFTVTMLFFSFTCHDTYMHSWGSIFVQDVLIPIRNKALSPEQHIKWLRWSIVFVGVFGFVFSLLYQPQEKILLFFAITGTIWLGGSGAVIIGGLYSRWGTTAGAYCALILGAVLGLGGLIVPQWYKGHYGHDFPINGQLLWFLAMVGSGAVYTVVSMLTGGRKKIINLDKIIHRGTYKVESDQVHNEKKESLWLRFVGITDEFSRTDRFLALYLIIFNGLTFVWFIVFSLINLFTPVSDAVWAKYWRFILLYYAIPAIPCTIWFTVGGISDIKALFKALSSAKRDHTDDGRVKSELEVTDGVTPISDSEMVRSSDEAS